MALQNDMFEDTINNLESIYKEIEGLKSNILDLPIQQFEILMIEDENGTPAYKALDENSTQECIDALENDIIPLFEENGYKEGLDKAFSYLKLFKENVRE
jgi:hypothetical protein